MTTLADDNNGRAAEAFGLTEYPYFVAVDSTGKVVARAAGELSIPSVERLLDEARRS